MKRITAMMLCLLLALGTLAACGDDSNVQNQGWTPQDAGQTTTQPATGESTGEPEEEVQVTTVPSEPDDTGMGNPDTTMGTGVEYISTLRVDINDYSHNGIVYYGENEKYGIMTLDGSSDTGAVYEDAAAEGEYFKIRTKELGEAEELDKINSVGLVDSTGKELIPARYALVEELSDRYYRVIEATELTDGDEYLIYMSKGAFSLYAGEDDPCYLGVWTVYDLETGAEVPGVTGTKATSVSTYGDILAYSVDGTRRYFAPDGQELPEDGYYYTNSTYYLSADKTVYDIQGNALLSMEGNEYSISNWDEPYYRVHKYADGVTTYALMDEAGNICSGQFPKTPYMEEGGLVSSDKKLYDLQGNCVFEKELYTVYYHNGNWLIRDAEKNIYLMDSNYTVEFICQMTDDTDYSLNGGDFVVTKRDGSTYYYYSTTTKQFEQGRGVAVGVIERDSTEDLSDLVNTMTDEVLLSGYRYYSAEESEEGIFIFARAEGDTYDVFFFAA